MQKFCIRVTFLAPTLFVIFNSSYCGPTSVTKEPVCWSTPGCTAGSGAACPSDYSNYGGTYVPPLANVSGSLTTGCGNDMAHSNTIRHPIIVPTIPTNLRKSTALKYPNTTVLTLLSASPPPRLPAGGTVLSESVHNEVLTESFVPTVYSQFITVTAVITTTILDSQGSTLKLVVGPSGEGWAPFNKPSGLADIPAPSVLPPALSHHQVSTRKSRNDHGSSSSLKSVLGGSLVTGFIGSQTVIDTFVPTIISELTSLVSTVTLTTLNSLQSAETIIVGPGGNAWEPLSQQLSGVPELPPPTNLPNPSSSLSSSTQQSVSNSKSWNSPKSTRAPHQLQSSVTDAFDVVSKSETTLVIDGVTLSYSKATFPNLATITSPTTATTQVVETNKDGSSFTIPAAIIVVGPRGVWWNGGSGGFGISGPSCIWPFCPPGGGGDIGGGGSGSDPKDPNTPGSNKDPKDPNNPGSNKDPKDPNTPGSNKDPKDPNTPGSNKDPKDPNTPGSNKDPKDPDGEDHSASQSPTSSLTSFRTSSTTASCSTSSVISDCSVLCSTATSPTSQTCSTICYSAITACSQTRTTKTSTASTRSSGQPCSPSCTACNAASIRLKTPNRGLDEQTAEIFETDLSKRTLRTPAYYNGDNEKFLLRESANAQKLDIFSKTPDSPSTAMSRALSNRRLDAAVQGLFGCTSIFVVSQQGVWLSHFWEIPSFRATRANWNKPATAEDTANFNKDVIEAMQNGDGTADMPGLKQYTVPTGQFSSAQKPVWAIITPRADSGVAGELKYDPEITQIRKVLKDLFPDAPPIVIDYVPRSDENSQRNSAAGKVLFQYDPFEAMIANPDNECEVYQQAIFRLWVEDRPLYVWQKKWTAQTNQLITDFSTYQNKNKRDGSSCQIPSSLVQAATELNGPNLIFSSVPDPDKTSWITLSGTNQIITGSSTHSSSATPTANATASSTPSITKAPTKTLQCMGDGAPWMSPTSFCDCGPNMTFPTLPPKSGMTTANCEYASLPSYTVAPITISSPPTNIPGVAGVPGCNYELADEQGLPSGSSDFCNCGGVTASLLVTTISGSTSLNCDYSTVPPGGFNPVPSSSQPAQSSTSIAPPPPRYATGRCNAHVWEGLGQEIGQKSVYIQVQITDAQGAQIGFAQSGLDWDQTFEVDSQLPYVLLVTPHNGVEKRDSSGSVDILHRVGKRLGGPVFRRPLLEKGPVAFAYGGQLWDSSAEQCSLGAYDNGNAKDFFGDFIFGDSFMPNRQMDCGFDC